MADISKELEAFRKAVYGEEVRGALISVAEKTNEVSEATEKAEKTRVSAENARVSAENTRVSQEESRKTAETSRASAEAKRAESENTRISQETARAKAETARGIAETKRADAEKLRVSQEEVRKTAESGRVEEENTRISQESARVEEEKKRASSEEKRRVAETDRVNAEEKRQTDTSAAIDNCNTASDRANKAAQDAEDVVAGKGFILKSEKGAVGGVATLDESGKIPHAEIPNITDSDEQTISFEMAAQRANIQPGDTLATAFGKLSKFCADLQQNAFEPPVQNLTTTIAGKALDAKMGKQLNDMMGIKADLTLMVKAEKLNDALKISLSNLLDPLNLTKWPVYATNGITVNMPEGCSIGIREFFYFNDNWYVVKITELGPKMGRCWYNRYDKQGKKWFGWVEA